MVLCLCILRSDPISALSHLLWCYVYGIYRVTPFLLYHISYGVMSMYFTESPPFCSPHLLWCYVYVCYIVTPFQFSTFVMVLCLWLLHRYPLFRLTTSLMVLCLCLLQSGTLFALPYLLLCYVYDCYSFLLYHISYGVMYVFVANWHPFCSPHLLWCYVYVCYRVAPFLLYHILS